MPPTPRYLTSGNYGTPISVRTCGGCALSGWRLRRPVEDLVTIAAKQCEAHARPPDNSAATQWRYGYLCDDLLNALCNSAGDRQITGPSVISGNLSKIGEGPVGIFDPHAFRNRAKAASTSFSLAASPLSPSSIAAISSGVASYSAPAKVRLDFQRNFRQLLLSVLRPGRHTF